MVLISFWQVNKKENSTFRPSFDDGVTLNGDLRNSDNFSIVSPEIVIDMRPLTGTVPQWNYCWIPDFGRFYWITSWVHSEGLWIASTSVDVLATYRGEIGDSDLYVLRSSAEFDPRMTDDKYPMTANYQWFTDTATSVMATHPTQSTSVLVPNYWNTPFENGVYAINVFGPNATGVTTYLARSSGFRELAQKLYSFDVKSSGIWDSITTEIPEAFAKAVADPIQFIESVRWYPFTPIDLTNASANIKMGYYDLGTIAGLKLLTSAEMVVQYNCFLPIRKHPQISDRGSWLMTEPYSNYKLSFFPFGEFDLETGALIDAEQLWLQWDVDYASGMGKLFMTAFTAGTPSVNRFISSVDAKVGIEIALNQNTINLSEGVMKTSLIAGAAGAAVNLVEALSGSGVSVTKEPTRIGGDRFGFDLNVPKIDLNLPSFKDLADAAVGGFKSFNPGLAPKLHTVGGVATRLTYCSGRVGLINSTFWLVSEEDNASMGRPLCRIRKPKDIPGYLLCQNPRIKCWTTVDEQKMILNYLSGGFFYE